MNQRNYNWFHAYEPAFSQAVQQMQTGQPTVVQAAIARCTVFAEHCLVVLDATCISSDKSTASSRKPSLPAANVPRLNSGSRAP